MWQKSIILHPCAMQGWTTWLKSRTLRKVSHNSTKIKKIYLHDNLSFMRLAVQFRCVCDLYQRAFAVLRQEQVRWTIESKFFVRVCSERRCKGNSLPKIKHKLVGVHGNIKPSNTDLHWLVSRNPTTASLLRPAASTVITSSTSASVARKRIGNFHTPPEPALMTKCTTWLQRRQW